MIENKILKFRYKNIYFCDYPFDVDGCDVVKFVNCKNKIDAKGFVCHEEHTSIIDLTQDLNTIWRKNRDRYEIRRAEREGIIISLNEKHDQFYEMHKSFMHRKGFDPTWEIGIPNIETMKKYGTLFIAKHEDEVLGGILYLEDKNHIFGWRGASLRLEVDKKKAALIGRADRLLHWEAIKYAKEKGIKEFDWGGLWPEEEANRDKMKRGINSFKLSFGGEVVTRYCYSKTYSKACRTAQILYDLVNHGIRRFR